MSTMKTRRKSKAAAAAAAADEVASSPQPESHSLSVVLPDDVDHESLASLVPQADLTTVSSETIVTLYRLLLEQAGELDASQRDLDEAHAEVERKDVELDQALQDRETTLKDLEGTYESLQQDFGRLKDERDQLLNDKSALQARVDNLSNSQSSSSTELDTLKHRVEDTEREKRDLLGVVSRLKQESGQQDEEIQTLRNNLKEARQDHQALEATVRELRSTETSTKFKLESLTQQLELARAEAERTSTELSAKSEEFSKYRRTKHAEYVALQASYDALTQTHATTEATLKALQSAHTAQTHQLTQALARVQDLTGQLAEQEATYASEASGLKRLISMMEEREKQAKDIVENIEREWAGVGEKSERREAALKEEIEREKKAREIAEKKIDQLETVLDRMGRGELPTLSAPGTPARGGIAASDPLTQSMMGLSPTIAMASKAQRSGKTFTEVYADYVRLQEDYAKKCAEYDHMDRTLTAVLAQIEERAPILSQQRSEYERLQSEAAQLASQLSQALSERDAQASVAHDTTQKLTTSARENELLQHQLNDLGRQVQTLLKELARRDDPMLPSDEELEQIAPQPANGISNMITNHLVAFRSITQLQEQNQKLLKITRELGDKLETEEREYRETMEHEQGEAVREAHEAIQELAAQLERQKKSSEGIIQAYVKERDTLKSMLAKAEARLNGTASNAPALNGNIDGSASASADQSELARELVEIQSQFETYRTEMGVDSVHLREEVISSQREIGRLNAELAKAHARAEFLNDRQRMNQDQFNLQSREMDALTKRNKQLYDQWTRLDVECARATEDLQIAHGHIEQLRTECANLRAEKKIWESVQSRLVEENRTLAMERSHLSDLMNNVQKMHNDLERSGENDRRRLENQLQMLENQTQELRTQISQERDNVRHVTLQKEIELKDLQSRLDKTNDLLSKTRESLVGAETSKKHLEERVEELSKSYQGAQEKLMVYERRPTTTNGSASDGMDQDLSREQQLEAEVAELRSSLKVAEVDLASARSHVQQFQEISQASEAALVSLNSTYDEYKASMEAQVARQESEIKSLEEKLQAAQDQLSQLAATHTELQRTMDTERTTWLNDKKTLEDTIVDMSTSEKNSESDRTYRANELRRQEQRAKAAEDRYGSEVVAHAEAIKTLEGLRRKLSTVQAAARESKTAAETAQAKLTASESSWQQQREALDKEVNDLNERCKDLKSQNDLLHQHLETVSSQAAKIRQAADSSVTASGEGESGDDADTKLAELRSVVAYLRKEKEIVDLQLELSKQENARLKAQIDHLTQNLDETRKTLSEERERAVEAAASSAQHAELLDRINQLNILRESNSTLRAECDSHSKRAKLLEARLQQLSAELNPAKEQAREAKAELEARDAQIKRLEEENMKWQERNTQLLSKYDRIDPAEMQGLKDEIEKLRAENAELSTTVKTQADRIPALENNVKAHRENMAKTMNSFKQRLGTVNKERSELSEKIKSLEAERTQLQESLEAEKARQTAAATEGAANQTAALAELRAERDRLIQERDKLIAEKDALAQTAAAAAEAATTAAATALPAEGGALTDAERAELVKARDEALVKAKEAAELAEKGQGDVLGLRRQNEKFQARIQDLTKARAADAEKARNSQAAAIAAAIERVKGETQAAPSDSNSEELAKRHAEELKALEQRLAQKHQEELKAAVESAVQAAKKDLPEGAPAPDTEALRATIEKELQAKLQDEISAAVERGRMEQAAKGKLKDAQLVKAQKKVKELEAQIMGWRESGMLPEAPPSTPAIGAPAVPSTPAAASSSTLTGKAPGTPATPTPAPNGGAGAMGLPRKPPGPGDAVAGRGRGTARGGVTRGYTLRGAARGGGPGHHPPSAPPKEVTSILGAAKRPREDGGDAQGADDSLAKRLKAGEPGKPTPPVPIRRPPPTT
ncbi:hypothetical protein HGRIS_005754 [Hohenbuehelia grisea]|uniref:Nucleoprotein TPR/MLP1 domain-containing protein n=1 Tax=Hohenbuehelia grisea TaxID=104357 RepID=A0ABR3JYP5_9AGAR